MRTIFYYAYIGDDTASIKDLTWRLQYIEQQMAFISTLAKKNNIHSLYTVATLPKECDGIFTQIATKHNFCVYTKLISRENCFEYPGFAAIRDFAESSHPEHLIYYCHSKGSVNISERAIGTFNYHQITNISNNVTNILSNNENLLKAGLYPSKSGFLWHNFFWVKARYLITKSVKKSSDRYYYESLIGEEGNGYKSVLGTLFLQPPSDDFNILDYFDSKDILGKPALTIMYEKYKNFSI